MSSILKAVFFILSATSAFANVLQSFIDSKNVIVFSSTRCPWCDRAKDLLKSQGIDYHLVELDTLPQDQRSQVYQELVAITKQTTVPNIFIKGQHIGGYDSISALHQKKLLKVYAQQEPHQQQQQQHKQ